MAKDKERSINPAQQQHKLEKAKALKKGKAEVQARRNEKLARRNPERLQRQVDDLKALEASGDIKPRERQILADLERDLRAVQKARDALGDKAPQFGNRRGNLQAKREDDGNTSSVLGKRGHDGERRVHSHRQHERESPGSETDESVRRIPMPRDTPPPIQHPHRRGTNPANANMEPLGEGRGPGERYSQSFPSKPMAATIPQVKTTYESAPQIRNLQKEAIGRFVPTAVRRKQEAVKGTGGKLLEPEEMDKLEATGYLPRPSVNDPSGPPLPAPSRAPASASASVGTDDETEAETRRLAEEEERFRRELAMQDAQEEVGGNGTGGGGGGGANKGRHVEIEEVSDEDL